VSAIEVAISPSEVPRRFWVYVVSSPAGEASATAELDARQLMTRRPELQQAVLASAAATRKVLSETERCIRDVGRQLFTALLGTGEVAGRYRASAALAAERGETLRVVVRIGNPVLAGLPWEAMYDETVGEYVCRREQLVRHVGVASSAARLAVDSLPLQILAVVSSPRGLPVLDAARERDSLEQALARIVAAGLAKVTWAPSATWPDLQDTLLGGIWHVVHFIGHGDFDPGRDEGILALTGENGRVELVEGSRLVDLLRQARPMPRLVLLNSCAGAAMGGTDLFSGTAAALARGGVSAVTAMQYAISDPAAIAFSRGFYGALAHGRAVDDAVSSGRVAIVGLSGRTLEWVTPVLYLRGPDSHLFTMRAASRPVSCDASPADQRRGLMRTHLGT
jgi:CHAT domain